MEVYFDEDIKFEAIELEVSRDVVIYSFIVQKSITYLDLSTCEYTLRPMPTFTEEQCRKVMEPRRRILYIYHLDLTEKLEHSLRSFVSNSEDYKTFHSGLAFHLGVIFVPVCLYNRDLAGCVIQPIMSARNKIEKLRRYLRIMKLLNLNKYIGTAVFLFDQLILALYPECTDSNLVVDFADTFCFGNWLLYNVDQNILHYVLHHAVQMRYTIFQERELGLDLINGCIVYHTPRNICLLLRYGTVLRVDPEVYLEVFGRFFGRRMVRRIIRKKVPGRRLFLMLQLFYYCTLNKDHWEGLLYIWRSIPDPCLSKSEIRFLFGNMITPKRWQNMIEYYKFYIIEESDTMDDEVPRPLQHLCRVVVRSALIPNYQLPYGIGMLGMPRLIRAYLNLEC